METIYAYLMSKSPHGNSESSCKSKISQLKGIRAPINKQILRFQISVENPMRVAVRNSAKDLVQVCLQEELQSSLNDGTIGDSDTFVELPRAWKGDRDIYTRLPLQNKTRTRGSPYFNKVSVFCKIWGGVHVLLQVQVEILKD